MAGHGPSKYKPGEVAWGAEHHIVPIPVYVKTILVLFLLMGLTIGASYVHFPGGTVVNNIVAISIALVKAALVVLFFMHIRWSTKLVRFWALFGFTWFLLMFFILVDYATRPIDPTYTQPWMHDPGSATPIMKEGPTTEQSDPLGINVRPRH